MLDLVGALIATQIRLASVRQAPNCAPFFAAVAALAAQPMVHYTGSTPGIGSWPLEVTSKGQATGSVTVYGQQAAVLAVGERHTPSPPRRCSPPYSHREIKLPR